ncbi:MAG: hypothetical protein LAO76_22480 [Acidobacteriia bacterium]|nr:hypothetical protein [Terriglobia bacterium]
MSSEAKLRTIHIFVQIENQKEIEVEFTSETVTVAQIKLAAGVQSDFALAIKREGRPLPLRDDEVIEIKNGEHFIAVPNGTVS